MYKVEKRNIHKLGVHGWSKIIKDEIQNIPFLLEVQKIPNNPK